MRKRILKIYEIRLEKKYRFKPGNPDSKQAEEMKGNKPNDGPYSKDKFEYDEDKTSLYALMARYSSERVSMSIVVNLCTPITEECADYRYDSDVNS